VIRPCSPQFGKWYSTSTAAFCSGSSLICSFRNLASFNFPSSCSGDSGCRATSLVHECWWTKCKTNPLRSREKTPCSQKGHCRLPGGYLEQTPWADLWWAATIRSFAWLTATKIATKFFVELLQEIIPFMISESDYRSRLTTGAKPWIIAAKRSVVCHCSWSLALNGDRQITIPFES